MNRLLDKIHQRLRWKSIEFRSNFISKSKQYQTSPGRRHILYHGVDYKGRTDINSRFISVKDFENQLNWMKDYCHVVSSEAYFSGEMHPEKLTVAISFDDGYKNNYSLVLPLLEKYQIPATFFIATSVIRNMHILWPDLVDVGGFVTRVELDFHGEKFKYRNKKGYISQVTNQNLKAILRKADLNTISDFINSNVELQNFMHSNEWKLYWELMSAEEIALASKLPLITIGSHGAAHLSLSYISEDSIQAELKKSKSWLENIIKKPVYSFAFPFGDYSPEIAGMVRKCGYKNIYCVDYRFNESSDNTGYLDRIGVNPHVTLPVQIAEWKRGSYG